MDRLTTDNPQNNLEIALNFAYAKDKKVYLRNIGDYGKDVELGDYIAQNNMGICDFTQSDILNGSCVDCCIEGTDCPFSFLFIVATQAAELRERLKEYEDAEES